MKFIFPFLCMFITNIILFAQNKTSNKSSQNNSSQGRIYVNLFSGLDNPNGIIGIGVNAGVNERVLAGIGIGLSSWGTKMNINGHYFFKEKYLGSAIGLSLNYSTGTEIKSINFTDDNTGVTKVLDAKGSNVVSANIMYSHYWRVGRKGRFFMHTGLANKFKQPTIDFTEIGTNVPFYNDILYKTTKIFSPGGLIASVGFLIAIN